VKAPVNRTLRVKKRIFDERSIEELKYKLNKELWEALFVEPDVNGKFNSAVGECESFGLYVTNKLKTYSSHTRNYAQHLISDILFSADQGEYEYGYWGGSNTMYPNYGYTSTPQTTHSPHIHNSTFTPSPSDSAYTSALTNRLPTSAQTSTSVEIPLTTPPHPSIQSQESEGFLEEYRDLIS
jgi:hypothetical protein